MPFQLRIISGPDEGVSYQLPHSGIQRIGRSHAHSDLTLHDLKLDRVHCEIELEEEQATLIDNDSSTGTFINGKRISRHFLAKGDHIRIGNSELCFEAIEEVVAAPPPAPIIPTVVPGQAVDPNALPAVIPVPEEPASPSLMALGKLAGTVLGNFQLGEVIGAGHVGVVFRARDTTKNREMALKVFLPEFPRDEQERLRFFQVVKNLLPLRHQNLVLPYGAGKTGTFHWLAREYVAGSSVAEMIRKVEQADQTDWRQAFRLAVQIGWALQFIHPQKLVHGNITPQNILFQDSDQVFKLSDLVTNKALASSQLYQLVLKAKALKELPYLAPEQTGGQTPVDGRTDIYALGAVVYALLIGRPPFVGNSPAETIALIRDAELVPPKALQSSVPDVVDRALRKMLARRPEERFQDADKMLAALAQITRDPAWQQDTA